MAWLLGQDRQARFYKALVAGNIGFYKKQVFYWLAKNLLFHKPSHFAFFGQLFRALSTTHTVRVHLQSFQLESV